MKAIKETFNFSNETLKAMHALDEEAAKYKVGGDTPVGSNETTFTTLWKASPNGCEDCHETGFRGRVGIYEVLGSSTAIQKLIVANATSNDIQNQAISEGMVTMQTDGIIKSLRGITTIEEVLRATKE